MANSLTVIYEGDICSFISLLREVFNYELPPQIRCQQEGGRVEVDIKNGQFEAVIYDPETQEHLPSIDYLRNYLTSNGFKVI
jgi:hypothetical protein